jgi:gamma-glutamyltranspeptidase/glutathione hydrolase
VKRLAAVLLCVSAAACAAPPPPKLTTPTWTGSGEHGAVSAGGWEAVKAGIEILGAGGNAADAAAATILALAVTDHTAFCFGGEVPILVYDAKTRTVEEIAGQGAAPALATADYFRSKGAIPASGLEPAAVPATLDAVLVLLERHGTISFETAVGPALRLLDANPKEWRGDLARTFRRLIDAERAGGLRGVADYFYRGPLAQELDGWLKANGGLIRFEDLAAHRTRVGKPVTADYRGFTVVKCGPWTQGPSLLQSLGLLEGFDLAKLGAGSADAIHASVEALKLALADRDVYYGDPLFASVPIEPLLSKEYAALRRPLLDMKSASAEQRPGDPVAMKPLLGEKETRFGLGGPANDTTTCVTADRWGNVVAATPSGWSGVVAGPTGVWMGTRLQSFNTWEGHPNCIAPGKRPRITLTPTLVLKDGRPVLAVSVAGGDLQDQVALQMVLNAIDFGLSPDASVTAPRFSTDHHVGSFLQAPPKPASLTLAAGVAGDVASALGARGHKVRTSRGAIAAPSVIAIDPATGLLRAAGDPKAGRHAAAY